MKNSELGRGWFNPLREPIDHGLLFTAPEPRIRSVEPAIQDRIPEFQLTISIEFIVIVFSLFWFFDYPKASQYIEVVDNKNEKRQKQIRDTQKQTNNPCNAFRHTFSIGIRLREVVGMMLRLSSAVLTSIQAALLRFRIGETTEPEMEPWTDRQGLLVAQVAQFSH